MSTYGKLLIEGVNDAPLFNVVGEQLDVIVIDFKTITDGQGNDKQIPTRWANYVLVEDGNWTQAHTDCINAAKSVYNAKPDNLAHPIPESETMIWSN